MLADFKNYFTVTPYAIVQMSLNRAEDVVLCTACL